MKLFFVVPFLFLMSCTQSSCISVVINQSKTDSASKDGVDERYLSVARLLARSKDDPESGYAATGFAVDKNHVLTAGHFCESFVSALLENKGVDTIDALYFDGEKFKRKDGYTVIRIDKVNDVCLLKRRWHSLSTVSFQKEDSVDVGDKISVLGAPLGVFPSMADGYVIQPNNRVYRNKQILGTLMLAVNVYPGNSGSPIYDENQKVVGMITSAVGPIAIAVRAQVLVKFLESCGVKVK